MGEVLVAPGVAIGDYILPCAFHEPPCSRAGIVVETMRAFFETALGYRLQHRLVNRSTLVQSIRTELESGRAG